MFELKLLSHKAIPGALKRARDYRLLGEPKESESICLDILKIAPENQTALTLLLLSITDQFGEHMYQQAKEARQLLPRLHNEYDQLYYEGLIYERQAKAALQQGMPGAKFNSYEWLLDAMEQFEKAETIHPDGNNDALLRWNTCVRLINELHLEPRQKGNP